MTSFHSIKTERIIVAGIFPAVGAVLATLPETVLGGCTMMMFGTIVIGGLKMVSACGFSQRNITVAALSALVLVLRKRL